MSLLLRSRIIMAGALVVAVWLAWQLATGDYFWPVLATVVTLGASLVIAFRVSLDAIVIGGLIFGYLVGNRGFAQLMPSVQLPLLPAEIGLLLAGGWLAVQSAQQRTLPFRRNLLNGCVLAWIVAGTVRVMFDVGPFGFVALRDYAMIYYASFFFIAQHVAGGESRGFLLRALVAASVVQPIAAALTEVFPDFFLNQFAVRGVPLIYFKGDLALTFTAVSALVLLLNTRGVHRWWAWPLATVELLYVIAGENRASMLGAVVALTWLSFSVARRIVGIQVASLAAALLVVSGLALLTDNPWAQRKFDATVERVASIGDLMGRGTYVTEESSMKGDNNRFRAVWWRTVVQDTLQQNPVFGLGFGYDLARNFLKEYNPDMADEFSARSPHSIVVSTIGRMGLAGLAVLALLVGLMVVRTWRVVRDPEVEYATLGLWAAVWVIFVSACLGVVLEGPMGAVVFWSLLGIANAPRLPDPDGNTLESVVEPGAALHPAARETDLETSPSR